MNSYPIITEWNNGCHTTFKEKKTFSVREEQYESLKHLLVQVVFLMTQSRETNWGYTLEMKSQQTADSWGMEELQVHVRCYVYVQHKQEEELSPCLCYSQNRLPVIWKHPEVFYTLVILEVHLQWIMNISFPETENTLQMVV